jgi:dCTP diphosphatase
MATTLAGIQQEVKEFCESRNWHNNEPNHLIVSVMIELAELSEHFQWKSQFVDLDDAKRTQIGFELVDVLIYLVQIANKCGISDITEYYNQKVPKLAEKYPVGSNWDTQHSEYRQSGRSKSY